MIIDYSPKARMWDGVEFCICSQHKSLVDSVATRGRLGRARYVSFTCYSLEKEGNRESSLSANMPMPYLIINKIHFMTSNVCMILNDDAYDSYIPYLGGIWLCILCTLWKCSSCCIPFICNTHSISPICTCNTFVILPSPQLGITITLSHEQEPLGTGNV